ncbi:SRPBCC family protein [Paenibacillus sp. TRM 82003]|nr:SRPBCC family protein [Paenibacillus sp. TRM 82003]
MPIIRTTVRIAALPELCFDLSRSIDLHADSMASTRERAVGGRTSGLIELGETVTWEATHLGVRQRLTSIITEMERPHRFVDEMVRGAFRRFRHEHRFTPIDGGTFVEDTFDYESPLGWIGRAADALFLERYMTKLLSERNRYIKQVAEARTQQTP